MADEVPPENESTISGVGTIEQWPYPFGSHADTPVGNDYSGQGAIELSPLVDEGNKAYHPFELEYHVDDEGVAELRCYYGVIHYSIAAIQTESFQVSSTYYFGVKGQSKLPGIGTVTPAGFVNQDTGAIQKYASKTLGTVNADGSPPDDAYGTVYLRFWVNAKNKVVQGADINFVERGGVLDQEEPCGELKKENNKLMREKPNLGRYHLKIGSFNSPEDSIIPITQMIEDHVYYATTVVENSGDPTTGEEDYSYTNVADTEDTDPDTFQTPITPQQPDPVIMSPRTDNNQTKYGPDSGEEDDDLVLDPSPRDTARNNPNYTTMRRFGTTAEYPQTVYYQQQAEWVMQHDPLVVPSQPLEGAAFGGTGAAGTPGTSDVAGFTAAGTIPGDIEDRMSVQIFGPDGSGGGSATSSSYSY